MTSLFLQYYRGAKAAIMVFDVTNEDTFHRVLSWLRDLKAHADPNVVICIAGNKCDKKPAFDITTCKGNLFPPTHVTRFHTRN